MRLVVYLILAAAVYLGMGKYYLSELYVQKFLSNHMMEVFKGNENMCIVYADDMSFSIDHQSPDRRMKVTGGKKEACNHAKKTHETIRAMRAGMSGGFKNVHVETSFPWLEGIATYQQTSTLSPQGMPAMSMVMNDKVTFKRLPLGLKITKVESVGNMR